MQKRLQKILAEAGIGSRRTCEQYILQGRVTVNNKLITKLGTRADPLKDKIVFDGDVVKPSRKKQYILINKPCGYLSSLKDTFNRPLVTSLIKGVKERLYPIGRLDYNSEGLLILSNDGHFSQFLTHPKHKILKTYLVKVKGIPKEEAIQKLSKGIRLEDGKTHPADIKKLKKRTSNNCWLKIVISEGRNRQIRRMCQAIGHPVIKLKRIKIGPITLGNLKQGEYRFLTPSEVNILKSLSS